MTRKKIVAATAVSEQTLVTYRVSEGVDRINGKKVTGSTVQLTAAQAFYDLSLGRITPADVAHGGA